MHVNRVTTCQALGTGPVFLSLFAIERLENAGEAQKKTKVTFNMPLLALTGYLRISILPGCCSNRLLCVVAEVVHCMALGEGKLAPP